MVRSYEVRFEALNVFAPWSLYLYEGDDYVDVLIFAAYDAAAKAGEQFLDGYYISILTAA